MTYLADPKFAILLLLFLAIVVFCLAFSITYAIRKYKEHELERIKQREEEKRRIQFVKDCSSKVKMIQSANEKYRFFDIPQSLTLRKECNSKNEFDRSDFRTFLISQILDDQKYYEDWVDKAISNDTSYSEYTNVTEKIMSSKPQDENYYQYYDYFEPIEDKLCRKLILKRPVTDLQIQVVKSYISPGGRNSYRLDYCFDFAEIIGCINEARLTQKNRESVKYNGKQ